MEIKIENLAQLKNFLNSRNDEELKQPLMFWGEEIGGAFDTIEILDEDFINPSGECAEPISAYLPGAESFDPEIDVSDEPIVMPKGTIIFQIHKAE